MFLSQIFLVAATILVFASPAPQGNPPTTIQITDETVQKVYNDAKVAIKQGAADVKNVMKNSVPGTIDIAKKTGVKIAPDVENYATKAIPLGIKAAAGGGSPATYAAVAELVPLTADAALKIAPDVAAGTKEAGKLWKTNIENQKKIKDARNDSAAAAKPGYIAPLPAYNGASPGAAPLPVDGGVSPGAAPAYPSAAPATTTDSLSTPADAPKAYSETKPLDQPAPAYSALPNPNSLPVDTTIYSGAEGCSTMKLFVAFAGFLVAFI